MASKKLFIKVIKNDALMMRVSITAYAFACDYYLLFFRDSILACIGVCVSSHLAPTPQTPQSPFSTINLQSNVACGG